MKRVLNLIAVAIVVGSGLLGGGSLGPAVTAQQTQPIPSANDDVRIVAGFLLAQLLIDIASREGVVPEGMYKLAVNPQHSDTAWKARVGGRGMTAQARAAASSSGLARSEILLAPAPASFTVTPNVSIKNPLLQRAGTAQNSMLNLVYKAVIEAEGAGQMEAAYALASSYLTNGLFNFFNRGADNGLARISSCLAGEDVQLQISDPTTGKTTEFSVECSKYKALSAVVANEVAPGAYSFLGPLVDIGCEKLFGLATDANQKPGLKLAAARAYVQGVQVFAGVFQPCIQPSEGQSDIEAFLAAAQQAKANNNQELLQELVGYQYQVYSDAEGAAIEIYSSFAKQRGLAKLLEDAETAYLEGLAQDTGNPEIGLAAWYELGNRWADRPEAQLRSDMNGATPAVRRAATKALLIQLGRVFDRQCLENLANGQECQ